MTTGIPKEPGKFANGAVSAAFTHLFNNEGGVGELVDALKRRNDLAGQVLDGASQFGSTMKAGGRHTLRNYKIGYFGSPDERARLMHVHQLTGNVLALAAFNPSALVDIFSLDGLVDNTVQFATGVGVNLLTKTPAASGLRFFAVSDLIYTNYDVMAQPIEYFHSKLDPLNSMGVEF